MKKDETIERNTADLVCKTSQIQSERSNRVKLDGPTKIERSWAKLDGDLSQSRRFRTIVGGLLSYSGRLRVEVDGHSTKKMGGPDEG